ncbi:DNA-protecting protein DprA [Aliarcobacter cryaerophilus]|uniref:DNA-processing protein DprA n=1 Tax=Aliarcobacter cryaerophilus TaxID=28198 RepID=UPI003DA2B248
MLSESNICIVSGEAIGIDTLAHKAAGTNNTIMISVVSKNKLKYTRINLNLQDKT